MRGDHRPLADDDALDHDRTRAEERAVLDDDRRACGGSRTPPMPTPPARCTSAPDLRARADRRPGVDHRPRPDPGPDVDVAGHEHDPLGEERAEAGDARAARRAPRAPHSPTSPGSCRGSGGRPRPWARPCAGGSRGGSPSSPTRSRPTRRRASRRRAPPPRSRSPTASSIGPGSSSPLSQSSSMREATSITPYPRAPARRRTRPGPRTPPRGRPPGRARRSGARTRCGRAVVHGVDPDGREVRDVRPRLLRLDLEAP